MSNLERDLLTRPAAADDRWELVQRVASSSYFSKGPKLRSFLLHVCENALLGRHENLTAQVIGTSIFSRPPDCDLREDNIVRVEARELRKRLDAYFEKEGRDEPVIIEVPKGSYTPIFRARAPAGEGTQQAQDGNRSAAAAQLRGGPKARRVTPLLLAASGLLALAFAAAAVWLWHENDQLRRVAGSSTDAQVLGMYRDLVGTMGADGDRETQLVLSNPGVTIYFGSAAPTAVDSGQGETVLAPPELKRIYGFALRKSDRELPYQFLRLTRQDFTGIGEAAAAFHVGRLFQVLQRPIRLTQSRFLNWDRVQREHLILLGGPASNDWSFQEDASSNFVLVPAGVRNAKPLQGEKEFYRGETEPAPGRTEYGVVKMLRSPYGFHTLILAGQTSAGTAGVAEFMASPARIRPSYDRIRSATSPKPFPREWEMLMQVKIRGEVAVETNAVAVRPLAPPS